MRRVSNVAILAGLTCTLTFALADRVAAADAAAVPGDATRRKEGVRAARRRRE